MEITLYLYSWRNRKRNNWPLNWVRLGLWSSYTKVLLCPTNNMACTCWSLTALKFFEILKIWVVICCEQPIMVLSVLNVIIQGWTSLILMEFCGVILKYFWHVWLISYKAPLESSYHRSIGADVQEIMFLKQSLNSKITLKKKNNDLLVKMINRCQSTTTSRGPITWPFRRKIMELITGDL